jgi:hypothetical protein
VGGWRARGVASGRRASRGTDHGVSYAHDGHASMAGQRSAWEDTGQVDQHAPGRVPSAWRPRGGCSDGLARRASSRRFCTIYAPARVRPLRVHAPWDGPSSGGAQPHRGDDAGHAAPSRRPASEARPGGRFTSTRDTRHWRADWPRLQERSTAHTGRRAQASVACRAVRGWWPRPASAPGVLRRSAYTPPPMPRALGASVRGATAA